MKIGHTYSDDTQEQLNNMLNTVIHNLKVIVIQEMEKDPSKPRDSSTFGMNYYAITMTFCMAILDKSIKDFQRTIEAAASKAEFDKEIQEVKSKLPPHLQKEIDNFLAKAFEMSEEPVKFKKMDMNDFDKNDTEVEIN